MLLQWRFEMTPFRRVNIFWSAPSLISGFIVGAFINYYGMALLSNGPLATLSWNVQTERNVLVSVLCAHVTLGLVLIALALKQVRRRGLRLAEGLFLGFSLSFAAYWAMVVWLTMQV
ncbi:MAG: hypothetical protein WCB99_01215 [Candidatus Cybelea sp.]